MTLRRHIQTQYNPKPGPDFRFDWEAIWSDDSSDGRHVGFGPTEAEAILDLKRLDEERAELLEDAVEKERNFPFSGSF